MFGPFVRSSNSHKFEPRCFLVFTKFTFDPLKGLFCHFWFIYSNNLLLNQPEWDHFCVMNRIIGPAGRSSIYLYLSTMCSCLKMNQFWYWLQKEGDQRNADDQQIQQVEPVSAKRALMEERSVDRHLTERELKSASHQERKTTNKIWASFKFYLQQDLYSKDGGEGVVCITQDLHKHTHQWTINTLSSFSCTVLIHTSKSPSDELQCRNDTKKTQSLSVTVTDVEKRVHRLFKKRPETYLEPVVRIDESEKRNRSLTSRRVPREDKQFQAQADKLLI